MALVAIHNKSQFGVGDQVRVVQKIKEDNKSRLASFDGMVIGIKGREENKSFTVRKIGVGGIGIERIFPLAAPNIEKVEVVKKGKRGVRHAKLYYTRDKSKSEIEKIYSRATKKEALKSKKANKKKATSSRVIKPKVIKKQSTTIKTSKVKK